MQHIVQVRKAPPWQPRSKIIENYPMMRRFVGTLRAPPRGTVCRKWGKQAPLPNGFLFPRAMIRRDFLQQLEEMTAEKENWRFEEVFFYSVAVRYRATDEDRKQTQAGQTARTPRDGSPRAVRAYSRFSRQYFEPESSSWKPPCACRTCSRSWVKPAATLTPSCRRSCGERSNAKNTCFFFISPPIF